ncbi:helix-turn-helix transcriptional regulator (plasmid) [Rhizobium sp. T1470]|uniref:helix-turn-helix domain-containing protein n=1 Tax=unclassified Rhizobium TaxID=2613769 RepID=UPI001CD4F26B|nr:helix-turn-helix transcriptional regulator [Rhizobium sp. T1473]MCA0805746.1 helix-turn-helix domain-containing protein [Rhizobium sp. T1473]
MVSSEQLKAARALLRWNRSQLAEASGLSVSVIDRLESQPGELVSPSPETEALVRVLGIAGVMFFDEGPVDGGPGVRLLIKPSAAIDINEDETVQYKEYLENDAPPGAGG